MIGVNMENKKYFLKKVSNYAIVGGLGATLMVSFSGCENRNDNTAQSDTFTNASQKEGAFVIVEKNPSTGGYQIIDEFPAQKTTIVLREDGKERILSKDEIDALVAKESQKIDNGTSNLTNEQVSSGGLSLGEALLASAAGALIGSYIGNKLFNNPNYQSQRRTSYKSPQTYSRSVDSFKKNSSATKSTSSSSKKSGFFGGGSSSKSKSFFGG
jgi:hypothetical protein